jgi:hypothetical protein
MKEEKGRRKHIMNYVVKHYAMKTYGGVLVSL